jgi:nitrogen regulatory protein PII
MKMILAILRPECLQEVQAALIDIGVSGLTVTEGRGAGNQEGYIECYRGFQYKKTMMAKIRIEVAVGDDRVDEAVELIRNAASTGEVGDGKIFVYALDSCTRVRTGEIGEASI